ncbi:unnamed protein product [Amoebophrya sp. A120]|nr:unnamed protein product [Amoebophrya sp. A120]|eukprot:GSA120T00013241001.1
MLNSNRPEFLYLTNSLELIAKERMEAERMEQQQSTSGANTTNPGINPSGMLIDVIVCKVFTKQMEELEPLQIPTSKNIERCFHREFDNWEPPGMKNTKPRYTTPTISAAKLNRSHISYKGVSGVSPVSRATGSPEVQLPRGAVTSLSGGVVSGGAINSTVSAASVVDSQPVHHQNFASGSGRPMAEHAIGNSNERSGSRPELVSSHLIPTTSSLIPQTSSSFRELLAGSALAHKATVKGSGSSASQLSQSPGGTTGSSATGGQGQQQQPLGVRRWYESSSSGQNASSSSSAAEDEGSRPTTSPMVSGNKDGQPGGQGQRPRFSATAGRGGSSRFCAVDEKTGKTISNVNALRKFLPTSPSQRLLSAQSRGMSAGSNKAASKNKGNKNNANNNSSNENTLSDESSSESSDERGRASGVEKEAKRLEREKKKKQELLAAKKRQQERRAAGLSNSNSPKQKGNSPDGTTAGGVNSQDLNDLSNCSPGGTTQSNFRATTDEQYECSPRLLNEGPRSKFFYKTRDRVLLYRARMKDVVPCYIVTMLADVKYSDLNTRGMANTANSYSSQLQLQQQQLPQLPKEMPGLNPLLGFSSIHYDYHLTNAWKALRSFWTANSGVMSSPSKGGLRTNRSLSPPQATSLSPSRRAHQNRANQVSSSSSSSSASSGTEGVSGAGGRANDQFGSSGSKSPSKSTISTTDRVNTGSGDRGSGGDYNSSTPTTTTTGGTAVSASGFIPGGGGASATTQAADSNHGIVNTDTKLVGLWSSSSSEEETEMLFGEVNTSNANHNSAARDNQNFARLKEKEILRDEVGTTNKPEKVQIVEELVLDENKSNTFYASGNICNLSKLKIFKLSFSDAAILSFKHVKRLSLANNLLETVFDAIPFEVLLHLEQLDLSGNRIQFVTRRESCLKKIYFPVACGLQGSSCGSGARKKAPSITSEQNRTDEEQQSTAGNDETAEDAGGPPSIDLDKPLPDFFVFEKMKKLNLSSNYIDRFEEVITLSNVFPRLTDLLVEGNPLVKLDGTSHAGSTTNHPGLASQTTSSNTINPNSNTVRQDIVFLFEELQHLDLQKIPVVGTGAAVVTNAAAAGREVVAQKTCSVGNEAMQSYARYLTSDRRIFKNAMVVKEDSEGEMSHLAGAKNEGGNAGASGIKETAEQEQKAVSDAGAAASQPPPPATSSKEKERQNLKDKFNELEFFENRIFAINPRCRATMDSLFLLPGLRAGAMERLFQYSQTALENASAATTSNVPPSGAASEQTGGSSSTAGITPGTGKSGAGAATASTFSSPDKKDTTNATTSSTSQQTAQALSVWKKGVNVLDLSNLNLQTGPNPENHQGVLGAQNKSSRNHNIINQEVGKRLRNCAEHLFACLKSSSFMPWMSTNSASGSSSSSNTTAPDWDHHLKDDAGSSALQIFQHAKVWWDRLSLCCEDEGEEEDGVKDETRNAISIAPNKAATATAAPSQHLLKPLKTTTQLLLNVTQILVDFKNVLKINLCSNKLTNLLFLRYGFPILEELIFDDNRISSLSGLESKCQTLIRVRGNNNCVKEITHLFSHTQIVQNNSADNKENNSKATSQEPKDTQQAAKEKEQKTREYVVVYSRLQYFCLQRNPLESFIICKVGGNHVAQKLLPSLVELYIDLIRVEPYKFYESYSVAKNTSVHNSLANSETESSSSSASSGENKNGNHGSGEQTTNESGSSSGEQSGSSSGDSTSGTNSSSTLNLDGIRHTRSKTRNHWTASMLIEDEPDNFLKRNVLVYLKNLPRLWVLQLNVYYPSRRTGVFSVEDFKSGGGNVNSGIGGANSSTSSPNKGGPFISPAKGGGQNLLQKPTGVISPGKMKAGSTCSFQTSLLDEMYVSSNANLSPSSSPSKTSLTTARSNFLLSYEKVTKRRQCIHVRDEEDEGILSEYNSMLQQANLAELDYLGQGVGGAPGSNSSTAQARSSARRNSAGSKNDLTGNDSSASSSSSGITGFTNVAATPMFSTGVMKNQNTSAGNAASGTSGTATGSGTSKGPSKNLRSTLLRSQQAALHQPQTLYSQEEKSRLLTIFYLKQLKVLNGISVTTEEQHRSNHLFASKLQVELVEELLNCELHPLANSVLQQMKVLDLSNQRLRDLSEIKFAQLFPHLRKLVLDNNPGLLELDFSNKALGILAPPATANQAGGTESSTSNGETSKEIKQDQQQGPQSLQQVANQTGINKRKESIAVSIHGQPLQKLVKLCLNGCTKLSPAKLDLSGVQHLETLELSNMNLTDLFFIPDSLQNQKSLKILRLARNEFQSVPDGCFAHLASLQFLDLSQNKIKLVEPDKSFRGLTELRELHLEENRLPSFGQSDAIATQGYIVTKNGVINYFAEDGKNQMPQSPLKGQNTANLNWFRSVRLKVLNLAFNRIQELRDVGRINELRGLHTVSLINNPFARKHWYRYQLINHVPNLKAIDSVAVTIEETERVAALVRQHLENNPQAAMAVVTVDALIDGGNGSTQPPSTTNSTTLDGSQQQNNNSSRKSSNFVLGANPMLPGSLSIAHQSGGGEKGTMGQGITGGSTTSTQKGRRPMSGKVNPNNASGGHNMLNYLPANIGTPTPAGNLTSTGGRTIGHLPLTEGGHSQAAPPNMGQQQHQQSNSGGSSTSTASIGNTPTGLLTGQHVSGGSSSSSSATDKRKIVKGSVAASQNNFAGSTSNGMTNTEMLASVANGAGNSNSASTPTTSDGMMQMGSMGITAKAITTTKPPLGGTLMPNGGGSSLTSTPGSTMTTPSVESTSGRPPRNPTGGTTGTASAGSLVTGLSLTNKNQQHPGGSEQAGGFISSSTTSTTHTPVGDMSERESASASMSERETSTTEGVAVPPSSSRDHNQNQQSNNAGNTMDYVQELIRPGVINLSASTASNNSVSGGRNSTSNPSQLNNIVHMSSLLSSRINLNSAPTSNNQFGGVPGHNMNQFGVEGLSAGITGNAVMTPSHGTRPGNSNSGSRTRAESGMGGSSAGVNNGQFGNDLQAVGLQVVGGTVVTSKRRANSFGNSIGGGGKR